MNSAAARPGSLISAQPAPTRITGILDIATFQATAASLCRDVDLGPGPTLDVLHAVSEVGQRLLKDRLEVLLSLRAMREDSRICLIFVLEFFAPDRARVDPRAPLSDCLKDMDEIIVSQGDVTRIVAVKWGGEGKDASLRQRVT
jgi:hypothetical protein